MYFAPHILQKRITPPLQEDEYGRPITVAGADMWTEVCRCRCDHSDDHEVRLDDGSVYIPAWHVVCEGRTPEVHCGDKVRCIFPDGTLRAEGEIKKTATLNCLPYAQVYL